MHGNEGLHWFVISKIGNIIELFDSLGSSEVFLEKIPKYKCVAVELNETAVQGRESKQCGEFSLYFLHNRFYNLDISFDDLVNWIFSSNPAKNETLVLDFINDLN